jgi:acyl-CoA synthetase (AMP-forming)/AMP-acid ligase II
VRQIRLTTPQRLVSSPCGVNGLATGENGLAALPGMTCISIWGEVLVAFVQVQAGEAIDEHKLMEFCRSRLASFKVPRIWKFVEQFPQTTSGKIQKFVLRDTYMKEIQP